MAVEIVYEYTLLKSLPDFEEYITGIQCIGNKSITSLPKLPGGLIVLHCSSNDLLTSLPELPNALIGLACQRNQLTSIPILPPNLGRLCCFGNKLTSLPCIPASVHTLYCNDNQLRELPELPKTMCSLDCSANKIKHIHTLPTKLMQFDCGNNQLTTLPFLPESLFTILCKGNPFKEPFKSWVDEYDEYASVRNNMEPLNLLRKRVNTYWTTLVYARDLKNMMVTVGQRELQAQMGNPRDESEDRVQDCLNADCLSVIAEFLTGEKGSVIQQRKKLHARA